MPRPRSSRRDHTRDGDEDRELKQREPQSKPRQTLEKAKRAAPIRTSNAMSNRPKAEGRSIEAVLDSALANW
jgi:hypothetical protein